MHDPFVEKYLPRRFQSDGMAAHRPRHCASTKYNKSVRRAASTRYRVKLLKSPHRSRFRCVAPQHSLARTRQRPRQPSPKPPSESVVKDAEESDKRFSRAKRRQWIIGHNADEERFKRVWGWGGQCGVCLIKTKIGRICVGMYLVGMCTSRASITNIGYIPSL